MITKQQQVSGPVPDSLSTVVYFTTVAVAAASSYRHPSVTESLDNPPGVHQSVLAELGF